MIENLGEIAMVLIGAFFISGFSFVTAFLLITHFKNKKEHE